jgi:alkylation response protein AidB-like acyl-CoA dehydrogenase
MDIDATRREVTAWLAENWDPDLSLVQWRTRLVDSGWACPSWPTEWFGRGLSAAADAIVAHEIRSFGAVGPPVGAAMTLVAPTLLEHGSVELKSRLLRPLLTGEHQWCQLFSEPGSGSDLASLSTRADRDGDEFVINGQKVWNTSAHHADYGMLLARTNHDVPKHRGITYFAFPMHQPGVEVRPLRQMNFHASFNEVFITDARVHESNVVGEIGAGWGVALTTLSNERRLTAPAPARSGGAAGRVHREASAEAAEYWKTYEWYPQRAGRPDLAVPQARAMDRDTDPIVRQELARLAALQSASQWTAQRAVAASAMGRQPGAEGSIGKLNASRIARQSADVHSMIAGAQALLNGPTALERGVIAEVLVSVPAVSIAGGTDEIQHNILGERVLGLPKEPSAPD